MKLTLQIQLIPDKVQAVELRKTIERFNSACNWLAQQAFARKTSNIILLQKLFYHDLRTRFGLSAQMAALCIRHTASACKRDKSKRPVFRTHATMPYDRRILSFKGIDQVSLKTLGGRLIIPMMMAQYQQERFSNAQGQCDLVRRKDGKWFLLVTIDLPEGEAVPVSDFLGVDLGIVNVATTSDSEQFSGEEIEHTRQRFHNQRQSLQKAASKQRDHGKRPKNIRRKLKRMRERESRFRRDVNHRISKLIVAWAKGSSRGIALEDLEGIRARVKFRKQQRARMAGWSFYQLRVFIEYKARLVGVVVVTVDPRNTSRTCSECGHCEKANRRSQSEFVCKQCGHSEHADVNAAKNIRFRAVVSQPKVAEHQAAPAA